MSKPETSQKITIWRLWFVCLVVCALFGITIWKTLDLQVVDNTRLKLQGDARTVRNDVIMAHRGNIMDRNGQPLAISTPVQSLWLNPRQILQNPEQWPALSRGLESVGIDADVIMNRVSMNAEREFLYIRRRMSPLEAQKVLDLGIKGVYSQEEYKRYYPLGEVAAHIVGLTNTDDVGQEGMELAYDNWLRGTPGSRQVLKDLLGNIISEVRINEIAEPGNNLELSIDSRIQYLAYKSLKEAVTLHQAASGTAIVLDVVTGEVLAMVNQPSYNPNNRASLSDGGLRNRAIIDLIEPGSTVKTFTITAALESGLFDTSSIVDTAPGTIRVDRTTIRDPINYGKVDLEKIITKSSQVGATRLALEMGEEPMLNVLGRVGFGENISTGFPGESSGVLPGFNRWSKSDIAAMAYGYGFHVTPLQLAQAYMIFANRGIKKPVSLLKTSGEVVG
ncbi:MAG: penicillin-binding protein 2, partial [Pseudohongiellaceae bacterium]